MPGESALENIPPTVLERIAFFLVSSGPDDSFLGPPSAITPLLLTSTSINQKLSYKFTSHLYSRLFKHKFDCDAVQRRLSQRWTTTRALRAELIKRCCTLNRIKSLQFDVDDLWTVYLMLLEDDGRNSAQLLDYAGLRHYIGDLIKQRAESQVRDFRWFQEPIIDTLVLWIYWLISDRESILREGAIPRQYLKGISNSLIITCFTQPSVYANDAFFYVPLSEDTEYVARLPLPKADIIHYSHPLRVAAPPIVPVAALIATVFAESLQTAARFPPQLPLPLDRVEANARGIRGPTVADWHYFHFHNRIHLRTHRLLSPLILENVDTIGVAREDGSGEGGVSVVDALESSRVSEGSRSWDVDWYRLVACHDPWDGSRVLRGPVYLLGSMSGSWAGRLLIPDGEHQHVLANEQNPSNNRSVTVKSSPLHLQIQEHHCLEPSAPFSTGSEGFWGSDDVLNAWFPKGTILTVSPGGDTIELRDPTTGISSQYTTFVPGATANDVSSKRSGDREESSEAVIADTESDLEVGSTNPAYIDNDDEYEDTVYDVPSGVYDIVITGETGDHHGDAWGHYSIFGRVRPWDGLVVFCRYPISADAQDMGQGAWIFRGYIHGSNLVGKWRETTTPIHEVGYEGGFVVAKD